MTIPAMAPPEMALPEGALVEVGTEAALVEVGSESALVEVSSEPLLVDVGIAVVKSTTLQLICILRGRGELSMRED